MPHGTGSYIEGESSEGKEHRLAASRIAQDEQNAQQRPLMMQGPLLCSRARVHLCTIRKDAVVPA
jgi:hypothetical protein